MSAQTPNPRNDAVPLAQRGVGRRRTLFGVAALAYLVCVVFYPVLFHHFEFVGGDVRLQVIKNQHVHGLTAENVKHILTSRCVSSYYPVRSLSQALDYQIWGLNPRGFKLTNCLIHLSNVLLVFWLIGRFFRHLDREQSRNAWWDLAAATFAAGIFAIHPVVVEPVTWVAGREELLMTLGALGTIHFHITARRLAQDDEKWGAVTCHTGAAFCCAFACFSNAAGAIIPLLIVAWDILATPRPRFWSIVRGSAALWAIAVATVVIKQAGQQDRAFSGPELLFAERLMLVLNVYRLNLTTILWPRRLGFVYPDATPDHFLGVEVIVGVAAVGLTCAALWLLRRHKLILFGLVWFGIALGPSSQIMAHHIQRADRFLYLPLAGLVLTLGIFARSLPSLASRRAARMTGLAAGVLVLILMVRLSAVHIWVWENELTGCKNDLRLDPENPDKVCAVADCLVIRRDFRQAIKSYSEAMRRYPENERILGNYAWALVSRDEKELRDHELAIDLATRACELGHWEDPKFLHSLSRIHFQFAEDLAERRKVDLATQQYEKAVDVLFNLATLLATHDEEGMRRPDEAVQLAERACQLIEQLDSRHLGRLAEIYALTGRFDEAAESAGQAIRMAHSAGETEWAGELRRRLKRYENAASSSRSNDPPTSPR